MLEQVSHNPATLPVDVRPYIFPIAEKNTVTYAAGKRRANNQARFAWEITLISVAYFSLSSS